MEILIHVLRAAARFRLPLESAMIAIFCTVLASGAVAAAEGGSLEYPIKAAYLYKFGMYVEWPRSTFSSPASALHLCIVGEDPFGPMLDAAVSGQRINGHPIVVRRLTAATPDSGCHILYLGAADAQRVSQHLEAVRGNGVLTVSDIPGVGIINFVIQDNRVRFDIDNEAAAQNGLVISSKLLSLALNVKPRQSK